MICMEQKAPIQLSDAAMENQYYFWLCDLIKVNKPDQSYFLLVKSLYDKVFTWTVPNDDNRLFEGRQLRERFCEENDIDYVYNRRYAWFVKDVSALEVIIALADRCESIMIDQCDNTPMRDWFWTMMANSGLDKFTDEAYYYLNGAAEVDQILTKIIDRGYSRLGVGGLFPLKYSKNDQRKVELWYQMHSYLIENYYVDGGIV